MDDLRSFLPIELHPFIDTLEDIRVIYRISHAKSVDKNHKIITIGFKQKWISLMITFGISMPLKVHIICEHLSDYFEMTGKTFRKVSDQVVESSHHKVKSFFESHPNYNHKEKESKESGEATLAGVAHFNSINI